MMALLKLIFILSVTICQLQVSLGFKFLVLAGDVSSHLSYFGKLTSSIVERGHHVDFVTSDLIKMPDSIKAMKNVTPKQYHAEGPPLASTEDELKPFLKSALDPALSNRLAALRYNMERLEEFSSWLLNDTRFLESLDTENYDFIIIDLILRQWAVIPYRLGVPSAIVGSFCFRTLRRTPNMPSYVPNPLTSFPPRMSFRERMMNLFVYILEDLSPLTMLGTELSTKYAPNRKTLSDLELCREIDVCIGMRDETLDNAGPLMPDIGTMAHLLVSEAKSLPTDIQSYVDSSQHGVIIVSFGSWMDSLPGEVLEKMLKAFSNMKQNVIFKLNPSSIEQVTDVPSNVKVMPWIPQADLLAHPAVKLIITHAGLNSMAEAVFHAVPMLAIPIALDQNYNAAIITNKGYGETVSLGSFTAEFLADTASNIINEPKYRENVRKASNIYKTFQQSGHRNPVVLMENVIQHGSEHLRSPAYQLYFYEYYMIDVFAVIAIFILCVTMAIYTTCRVCCRNVLSSNKEKLE